MKKTFLSLVISSVIIISGTAFAQKQEVKQEAKPVLKESVKTEKKSEANPQAPGQVKQRGENRQASPRSTPEERAKMAVERIGNKVKDLTDDQKTKLTALHLDAYTQMDKDRAAHKDDQEKLKTASKANSDKLRDGLKSILTADQYKAYTTPPPRPAKQEQPAPTDQVKPKPQQETKPGTEIKNK